MEIQKVETPKELLLNETGEKHEDKELFEMPEVILHNVVCRGDVHCKLNLEHCNTCLQNSSLNKKRFPAVFVRAKNVTLLLFSTVIGLRHVNYNYKFVINRVKL